MFCHSEIFCQMKKSGLKLSYITCRTKRQLIYSLLCCMKQYMNLAISLKLIFLLFVIKLQTKWFLPRLTFSLSSANDGTLPKFKPFECTVLFTFLNIPNTFFIALLKIIRQKMDYSPFNEQLLETF